MQRELPANLPDPEVRFRKSQPLCSRGRLQEGRNYTLLCAILGFRAPTR